MKPDYKSLFLLLLTFAISLFLSILIIHHTEIYAEDSLFEKLLFDFALTFFFSILFGALFFKKYKFFFKTLAIYVAIIIGMVLLAWIIAYDYCPRSEKEQAWPVRIVE